MNLRIVTPDMPVEPMEGPERTPLPCRSRTMLAVLVLSAIGACTTTPEPQPRGIEPWVDGHPTGTFVIDASTEGEASLVGILRGYVNSVSRAGQIAPNQLALDDMLRTELRPGFIADLDARARAHPPDGRALGFRVGLRMTQGRFGEALEVAESCDSPDWWCLALQGMALHGLQRAEASEARYRASLLAMPSEHRCHWVNEAEVLLDGAVGRRFRASSCDERAEIAEELWWLGDPLFALPGNDRFNEHMTRVLLMELHHFFLESTGRSSCSFRHHVPMILGGWHAWEWDEGTHRTLDAFVPGDGYRFLPDSELISDPWNAWSFDPGISAWHGKERHTPSWGTLVTLDSQVAIFRRGSDVLVVATSAPTEDAAPTAALGRFALALSPGSGEEPHIAWGEAEATRPAPGSPVQLSTRAEDRPWVVSIEAMPGTDRVAGRARSGHLPLPRGAGGLGVSDLALFSLDAADQDEYRTLTEVLPHLLGTTRIPADRPIGVFWEVYDAPDGAVDFALRIEPGQPGLVRRTLGLLRLTSLPAPVRVGWRDDEVALDLDGRSLRLDLGRLDPGVWEIVLEVAPSGSGLEPLEIRRRIEVVGP